MLCSGTLNMSVSSRYNMSYHLHSSLLGELLSRVVYWYSQHCSWLLMYITLIMVFLTSAGSWKVNVQMPRALSLLCLWLMRCIYVLLTLRQFLFYDWGKWVFHISETQSFWHFHIPHASRSSGLVLMSNRNNQTTYYVQKKLQSGSQFTFFLIPY